MTRGNSEAVIAFRISFGNPACAVAQCGGSSKERREHSVMTSTRESGGFVITAYKRSEVA